MKIHMIAFMLPLLLSACGGSPASLDTLSFSSEAASSPRTAGENGVVSSTNGGTSSRSESTSSGNAHVESSSDDHVFNSSASTGSTSVSSSSSNSSSSISSSSASSARSSSSSTRDLTALAAALETNKQKWKMHGIKSYQYKFEMNCVCIPELWGRKQATVHEGKVTEAFYLSSGSYLPSEQLEYVRTIDHLFAVIDEAISKEYEVINVIYNTEHGYPEVINVDVDTIYPEDIVNYYVTDLSYVSSSSTSSSTNSSTSNSSNSSSSTRDLRPIIDALRTNKEKWEMRDTKSYQFKSWISCFCWIDMTSEKQATVHEGIVTEAFFLKSSEYLTAEQRDNIYTIDELFSVIALAIEGRYEEIRVIYNAEYGYPEMIYTDRRKDTIDDEITYHSKDLM